MHPETVISDTITQTLLNTLELRDKNGAGHSHRVAMLAVKLGQALGLSDQHLVLLRRGAMLHDLGKIGVPDRILFKPGSLTSEEWGIIRQHPARGADLIRPIPEMQDVIPIVLCHHEHWDGSGYPSGLTKESIPFLARICAVAEVFDSLMSDLVYRPAWPTVQVLQKMQGESGTAFDPSIVEVLPAIAAGF